MGNGKSHAKWQPTSAAVVKDGDNESESILVIETNLALKPDEVILAASDILNEGNSSTLYYKRKSA